MQRRRRMATFDSYYKDVEIHDHTGARWLAVITTLILLTILVGIVMLAYPHMARA
jgi:hypothetical protein